MKIFSLHHKLADIIFHNPAAITVLNRFNIRLGVGNETLEQACSRLQLDAPFVEVILNISLNEDYFPERAVKTFTLPLLNDYLLDTLLTVAMAAIWSCCGNSSATCVRS